MKNIINVINKVFNINNYYKIDLYAKSITYYMVSSIAPITLISIAILNLFNKNLHSPIILEILNIISSIFGELIIDVLTSIQLSGFSIVLIFTIIYSAAKVINSFNKFSFEVYRIKRHKNFLIGLTSSGLLFIILIGTILFELMLVVFGKSIFNIFTSDFIIIRLLEFCLEIIMFFITISILYIYIPPIKIKFKNVLKGSIFSTLIIYIVLGVFTILFNFLYKINNIVGISFIISMFSFVSYFIYYILLYGLVINYNKKIL